MKLVSYNIRFGLGTDHEINLERIADSVRDADIIGLQEVERFWERSAMVDQPETLGNLLKNFHWVYGPVFDMDASERQDDGSIINRRRQFGPMVLSRWPIRWSRLLTFPKLGTVGHFNMDTGAIECAIETPSRAIKVCSLHLSPVSSRNRLLQIDHLLDWHRRGPTNGGAWTGRRYVDEVPGFAGFIGFDWSGGEDQPPMPTETVVMGDFNSGPESEEYRRMVGTTDPFYGLVEHVDSFVDSWSAAQERSAEPATWYPDPPGRAPGHGLRLDYCFVDPHLGQMVRRAWVDHEANGSDHRPYWVELDI
jgi:endonuclease/exonuclease/phosphatase family metal-dependent hydrolase